MIESNLLANQPLHAAHPWREIVLFHVQLAIHWELAVVTVRAQIPGPRQCDRAQGSEYGARAEFAIARLLATCTGYGALVGYRLGKLQ